MRRKLARQPEITYELNRSSIEMLYDLFIALNIHLFSTNNSFEYYVKLSSELLFHI